MRPGPPVLMGASFSIPLRDPMLRDCTAVLRSFAPLIIHHISTCKQASILAASNVSGLFCVFHREVFRDFRDLTESRRRFRRLSLSLGFCSIPRSAIVNCSAWLRGVAPAPQEFPTEM
jgi:hypothetical protein